MPAKRNYARPGQPTKYKPEYCAMLIKHMRVGYSFYSFGANVGVHQDTLHEWCTKFPEFSDARKEGTILALRWWERQGKKALNKGGKDSTFNTTLWIFCMKAKFKEFGWIDRVDVNASLDDQRSMVVNLIGGGKIVSGPNAKADAERLAEEEKQKNAKEVENDNSPERA